MNIAQATIRGAIRAFWTTVMGADEAIGLRRMAADKGGIIAPVRCGWLIAQHPMLPFFEIARVPDVTVAQHPDGIIDICCGAAREGYNRVVT
ncbi:hypothetical protein [Paraburkholderia caffeinilytica]|uniref:hypothetical protein n=1 Tax=Paraburkholderia caffeinilytica TaxID=1761016 RepID=UPI003DA1A0E2